MAKKSSSSMTAPKLRLVLIITIVLLVVVGGAGFYFAREKLSAYASEVSVINAAKEESDKNIQELTKIKDELDSNSDAIKRTSEIVAPLENFEYQNKIIQDVQSYAAKAGVQVKGFSFTTDVANANSGSGTTSGSAAAAGTAQTGTKTIAGLKKVTTTVELASPIEYPKIMNFLYFIEHNLTKMQLQGVSLTRDPKNGNVTAGALNLEVYVRG